MKSLSLIVVSLAAVLGLSLAPLSVEVGASGISQAKLGAGKVQTGGDNSRGIGSLLTVVTNVLLFIIGAIAVIMLIIGGIKYTTSNGNPEQIKSAKNTIMYAIIGLIVAIAASAIVDFVLDQL